jgi:hypothetical protein
MVGIVAAIGSEVRDRAGAAWPAASRLAAPALIAGARVCSPTASKEAWPAGLPEQLG